MLQEQQHFSPRAGWTMTHNAANSKKHQVTAALPRYVVAAAAKRVAKAAGAQTNHRSSRASAEPANVEGDRSIHGASS